MDLSFLVIATAFFNAGYMANRMSGAKIESLYDLMFIVSLIVCCAISLQSGGITYDVQGQQTGFDLQKGTGAVLVVVFETLVLAVIYSLVAWVIARMNSPGKPEKPAPPIKPKGDDDLLQLF